MDDYGALLQSGYNAVPDYNHNLAFQVGIDGERLQQQALKQRIVDDQQQNERAQSFQTDLTSALHDGRPGAIAQIMMKYPEFADKVKAGWTLKTDAAKQADLTSLGEMYSAAGSGDWALAAKLAHARHDADRAAGQSDAEDDAFVDAIDKAQQGDETQRKVVLGTIGTHLAAVAGPEHFASVYGALKGGIHVIPMGGLAVDDEGKTIAHSPLMQDANGNIRAWNDQTGGGGPVSGGVGTGMSPAVASVASTLSTALPKPVVAGFLGNFHAEGGYDGAQGDGGSASGIAQWHNDRAANFEKVIGKPVTQATPEEQAKFVLYEMQHPEEAGMTVKQRDAIMAAKTPAQAAALIDQYYERSDGKARQGRMSAATAFASNTAPASGASPSSQFPVIIPGKDAAPPEGFRWTDSAHTSLEPIPGGPKDPSASDNSLPVHDAAVNYLLTGQMPPLGNGGAGYKQQIIAERSKLMQQLHISPEQLPEFQAQYTADKSALQKNTEMLSTLQSSENALKANGQQVWNTHRVLVQDGIIADNPWITRKQLKYYQSFGSPDQKAHVKAYLDAVNAYSTEYSKFMTAANGMGGSAAPSDSARELAGELNDPGLAATPLLAHLRQGLTEAINKRNGVAQQTEALQQKLSSYLHPHSAAQTASKGEGSWITLPSGLKIRKIH
jgi:ABC-type transporter MlaC component